MSKVIDIHTTDLCSEWAADPIDLEIQIRRAEKQGWSRVGLPYVQEYSHGGVPAGLVYPKAGKTKEILMVPWGSRTLASLPCYGPM